MTRGPVAGRDRRPGPATVLVATGFTLFLGFAHKSLCLTGEFDARAYRSFCYTDIVPLFRDEGLFDHRIPYLEADNEYPVGTGMVMWVASIPSAGEGAFLLSNVVLLSAAALTTSWLLWRAVGHRALYFALSPSLFLYAFLNWDLIAVMLAVAAVLSFLRGSDTRAGLYVGLGAAVKVFPALLLVPFALQRAGERAPWGKIVLVSAATWVAINGPFAVAAFDRWSEFFRFSAERLPTFGSTWSVACRAISGTPACGVNHAIGLASLLMFVLGSLAIVLLRRRSAPEAPAWTLGIALMALFLLVSKVASPQYSLWLVPWFALVLPRLRLFLLFQAVDVAVFLTEFSFLARISGTGGLPSWALGLAVSLRAAVLIAIIVAAVRRPSGAAVARAPAI